MPPSPIPRCLRFPQAWLRASQVRLRRTISSAALALWHVAQASSACAGALCLPPKTKVSPAPSCVWCFGKTPPTLDRRCDTVKLTLKVSTPTGGFLCHRRDHQFQDKNAIVTKFPNSFSSTASLRDQCRHCETRETPVCRRSCPLA